MPTDVFAPQLTQELEQELLALNPEARLRQRIRTVHDIYQHHKVLKRIPFSEDALQYLASIILDALDSSKRFRKTECLKVLRAILRNSDPPPILSEQTLALLFRIYVQAIDNLPDEGKWAASVLSRARS